MRTRFFSSILIIVLSLSILVVGFAYVHNSHIKSSTKQQSTTKNKSKNNGKITIKKGVPISLHDSNGEPITINKGIENTGITCYAASLFQCLNNVEAFRKYFCDIKDPNKEISSEIGKIFNGLNPYTTLNISYNLQEIFKDPAIIDLIDVDGMNDVKDFYEALLNSAIKEELGIFKSRDYIILDDDFYNNHRSNNSYLIKNFILDRVKKDNSIVVMSLHYPFLDVEYRDTIDFEASIYENFHSSFKTISGENKVLVVQIENTAQEFKDVRLKKNITFERRKYTLKAFCVNKGGHRGHYISRIVKGDTLIEYNDDKIHVSKLGLEEPQGRVRLIFYELE